MPKTYLDLFDFRTQSRIESIEKIWINFFRIAKIKYEYNKKGTKISGLKDGFPRIFLVDFKTYVIVVDTNISLEKYENVKELCEKIFESCACFVMIAIGTFRMSNSELLSNIYNENGGGLEWNDCFFATEIKEIHYHESPDYILKSGDIVNPNNNDVFLVVERYNVTTIASEVFFDENDKVFSDPYIIFLDALIDVSWIIGNYKRVEETISQYDFAHNVKTKPKPIETIYDGYRFRSRTEAKWAVFFNEINKEYEYEPEGYQLSNGMWYLPDFYIPSTETFIEVKGTYLKDFELEKIERLAESVEKNVFIVIGIPKLNDGKIDIFFYNRLFSRKGLPMQWDELSRAKNTFFDKGKTDFGATSEELETAIKKARMARFEYGETPEERPRK